MFGVIVCVCVCVLVYIQNNASFGEGEGDYIYKNIFKVLFRVNYFFLGSSQALLAI